LNDGNQVLLFFYFDEKNLSELPKDDARVMFIHELLSKIQNKLPRKRKSQFFEEPKAILKN
jgi:deoxyribodipyrimidine photo-lyase